MIGKSTEWDNYIDGSSKPSNLSYRNEMEIELGKAQTYADKRLEGERQKENRKRVD